MTLKKMAAILIAGMLSVSVFAACENESGMKNSSDLTKEGDSSSGEAVTLEMIRWGGGLPSQDEDIMKAEFLKRLNINVELVAYNDISDYINVLNTRAATGAFPDLFWVNQEILRKFSSSGMAMDLTDAYNNELVTVKNWLSDSLNLGMVNGKYYGVPVPISFEYSLTFVRQDWLDNLGLTAPKTIDEFYDVAVAFTDNDPDGNGKQDTFGLTGNNGLRAFSPIFGPYGVALPTNSGALPSIYSKDGKLVSTVTDPDIKDAILEAKRFVDAGVIDPELFGNKGSQAVTDKAFQGSVGITRIEWSLFAKEEHIAQAKAVNPNANWIPIEVPKNGSGKELDGDWQIGTTVHMFAIPATLSSSPEKQEALFRLLNYISTPDGNNFVAYGPEGEYHNVQENGEVELINLEKWNETGLQSYIYNYQFTGRGIESVYLGVRFPNEKDVISFAAEQPRIRCLNGFVDFPENFTAADAATYAEEELIKFIYGRRPIEEYDDFLDTLLNLYNFQAYLDRAEEVLVPMGLLK